MRQDSCLHFPFFPLGLQACAPSGLYLLPNARAWCWLGHPWTGIACASIADSPKSLNPLATSIPLITFERFVFATLTKLSKITKSVGARLMVTACRLWSMSFLGRPIKKRGMLLVFSFGMIKTCFACQNRPLAIAFHPPSWAWIRGLPGLPGTQSWFCDNWGHLMMKDKVCRDCGHRSRQSSTRCSKCKGYMRVIRPKKTWKSSR